MNPAAISPHAFMGSATTDAAAFAPLRSERFEQVFAAATRTSDEAGLRQAASELVATAFVAPVLATARQGPLQPAPPFAPGAAEKRFMPLLDQHFADRVTQASKMSLVDAIVQRYSRACQTIGEAGGAHR